MVVWLVVQSCYFSAILPPGDRHQEIGGSNLSQISSDRTLITDAGSTSSAYHKGYTGVGQTEPISISLSGSPTGIAFNPVNGDLYANTPLGLSSNVTVINSSTNLVIARVLLPTFSDGPLAADAVTGMVYVGDYSSTVYSISPSTNKITGTVPLSTGCSNGCAPYVQMYDNLNGAVYITSLITNDIYAINRGSFVASVPVGVGPNGVALDTNNGELFVSNEGSSIPSNVTIVDGKTNRVVGETYGAGGGPGIAYDSANGDVYTCTNGVQSGFQNNVSVVNAASRRVVATILTDSSCGAATFDPANGYVYITDQWAVGTAAALSNVTLVDPTTNRIVGRLPVGSGPGPVAFDPLNHNMYVGNVVSENITVLPQVYRLTFDESGLPPGTNWSVDVGRTEFASRTTSVAFPETNGTRNYTVLPVAGFEATPASGQVFVLGGNATLNVTFVRTPYTVSFNETGLPTGTAWTVSVDGAVQTTSNASLLFPAHNGTYNFTVHPIRNYTVLPQQGTFGVAGGNITVAVTFAPVAFHVVFTETGLPNGTNWSVTVNGSASHGIAQSISFVLKNGTYDFIVDSPPGYDVTPSNGSFRIQGTNQTVNLLFTTAAPNPSLTLLGLSAMQWDGLIALILLVATVAIIVFFHRRDRRAAAIPAPPA